MKLFAIKYHSRVVGEGRYQVNVYIGAQEYLLANELRIGLVLLEYQEEAVEETDNLICWVHAGELGQVLLLHFVRKNVEALGYLESHRLEH